MQTHMLSSLYTLSDLMIIWHDFFFLIIKLRENGFTVLKFQTFNLMDRVIFVGVPYACEHTQKDILFLEKSEMFFY
jgi:hypothetical protein